MRRVGNLALLVLLIASGCQGQLVRRGSSRATPVPEGDVSVGEGVGVASPGAKVVTPAPEAAKAGATPTTNGTFLLTLMDGRGGRPDGITVEIQGPVRTEAKSSQGKVRVDVPPGSYTFAIPAGCRDEVFVSFGGTASAGVAKPGQLVQGELRVDWKHRWAPDSPVHASYVPDFPIGKTVDVRFDVRDRCSADLVPNADYRWVDFKPTPNLRFVNPPAQRADGSGWGHLKIACTGEGEARLVAVDRTNPNDQIEVLAKATGKPPMCIKA